MKISRFATAFALAVGLSIPQTAAQARLAGHSDEQPTRELAVRDVYSCPAPEDVQGEAKWKINNTTGLALTVYVSDEKGNAYQVLERVGTPAVREWTPQLEDGTYHLTCVFHNDSAVESDAFTVMGSTVSNAPKMVPITDHEVAAVSIKQAENQKKRVPELQKRAHALADATSSSRPAAQAAYLDYLEYYRSFDDSSAEWPGPDLEGYEDIERVLWSNRPPSDAARPAAELADATDKTAHALDTSHFAIPAPDYGLRAHEVMEEFERFDLRGERDFGAHALPTALRGVITSTRMTLDPVRSLVEDRGLDTAPIYDQLADLDSLAEEFDDKYGGASSVAFADWPQEDRLRLQAGVAKANELLAPVATMTVIRRMN